jgi:hypothetical protein
MLARHEESQPDSRYIAREIAPMLTLDRFIESHVSGYRRVFLKLDVQGYEASVLEGLTSGWPRVCGIRCELSLVPVYEGAPLWREVSDKLARQGFRLADVLPGFRDNRDGQLLQFDAVFVRELHFPAK